MTQAIAKPSGRARQSTDIRLRCPRASGENRPAELIYEHYRIERALADRLRNAPKKGRAALYREVYDELFERVPHHQQLTLSVVPDDERIELERQFNFLKRFLQASDHLLEVGTGDGALSRLASKYCTRVTAVDVSEMPQNDDPLPEGMTFRLLPDGQLPQDLDIDVAYSNQLMEHLHPDDAKEQLEAICRSLKPGGRYVCITPNAVSGPWDISMYFDERPTGLHLREYRVQELVDLMKSAGFKDVRCYAGGRGKFARVPKFAIQLMETGLSLLPYRLRSIISRTLPVRGFLGLRLVAWK